MSNMSPLQASFGRVLLYVYYLTSTLTFRTYASWKKAGQPNPFICKRTRREDVSRNDIAYTFEEQFRPRTRSRIYGPVTSRSVCPR